MLGRRHRRWVNIEPTMGERLVLAGLAVHQIYTQSDSSYVYHMYDLYTLRLHPLHASNPLYMEDEARAQGEFIAIYYTNTCTAARPPSPGNKQP